MWNWITCYLSGNHEFGIACEPGEIFLRCAHCGKRSAGWALSGDRAVNASPVTVPASSRAARSQPRTLTRAA